MPFSLRFPKKMTGGLTSELADRTIPIYGEEPFVLPDCPDILGGKHPKFGARAVTMPAFNVHCFNGGIFYPKREEIFTADGIVVTDSTAQKRNHFLGRWRLFPKTPRRIPGTVAHLCLTGLENNYYHWIVECLGRVHLLRQSGIDPDYYCIANHHAFQKQYLQLLGIPEEKIVPTTAPGMMQADILIYPTLINNWEPTLYRNHQFCEKQFVPSWIGHQFQSFQVERACSRAKRIFIDRSDTGRRRLLNKADLNPIFEKFGFSPIFLENKSVLEQIETFANAEIIVGIHGSGLTNMVHSAKGVKILELFPKYYHDPALRLLAAALGHRYSYLIGEHEPDKSISPQFEDLCFSNDIFEKSLAILTSSES